MIERTLQLSGSMHPEEVRDSRRKSLAAERANLQSLLTDIQSTRANMAANVQKADELVEKLRAKLEKDIDDSLKDEPKN
jgi:flagellar biosynthesis component FlhA